MFIYHLSSVFIVSSFFLCVFFPTWKSLHIFLLRSSLFSEFSLFLLSGVVLSIFFACFCFSSPSGLKSDWWGTLSCSALLKRRPHWQSDRLVWGTRRKALFLLEFSAERCAFAQNQGKAGNQHTRHLPLFWDLGGPEVSLGLWTREA